MIYVNKNITGDQVVIDMNDNEAKEHLLPLFRDYLNDKDRNEHDGSYEIIKDLYNKIINEK